VLTAGAARAKSVNLAFAQEIFVGFRQYDHGPMILRGQ
jgi:hypothetical protein